MTATFRAAESEIAAAWRRAESQPGADPLAPMNLFSTLRQAYFSRCILCPLSLLPVTEGNGRIDLDASR